MDYLPGLLAIAAGLVFIAISVPLLKRQIKPNQLYGFRIPKAFESEENWYKINEYGARQMIRWSVVIILIGSVALFIPPGPEDGILAAVFGLAPLLILIPAIQTILWANRLQ